MAVVKGKLLNDSDKIIDVAKDDDRAASEYAYLIATISDDWGRFKLSPRRILADAYEYRPQVNELMVADWLAIYEKHGLLKTYTTQGRLWAEWTNWQGQAASQRRFHHAPEPPWSTHAHSGRCRLRGASRKPGVAGSPTPKHQKSEKQDVHPASHKEPAVPAVPVEPARNGNGDHVSGPPPDINPLVEGRRPELELECLRLVREIAAATGDYPEHVMGAASGYKGRQKLNPSGLRDTRLLHTVIALRKRQASIRGPTAEDGTSHGLPAKGPWEREGN